jgi:1-acyl-sn-glycerol-3-phosphate acyltransferase
MRPLRYLYRLPLLVLHVVVGLSATILVIVFVGDRMRVGDESLHHYMIRWWSGLLCRVFGLRVDHCGDPAVDPVLLVANHVSWLDIEVIQAERAASFVGKVEIRSWPFIGWVASLGGTVFHQRGSGDSSGNVTQVMTETLRSGRTMAIFPEGRTGRGDRVLPFHGRLLQAAIEAECPVQPVAIRFVRDGKSITSLAFAEGESFLGNFWRVLGDPPSIAEVHYLPPIVPAGQGRREIINQARDAIVEVVQADD